MSAPDSSAQAAKKQAAAQITDHGGVQHPVGWFVKRCVGASWGCLPRVAGVVGPALPGPAQAAGHE